MPSFQAMRKKLYRVCVSSYRFWSGGWDDGAGGSRSAERGNWPTGCRFGYPGFCLLTISRQVGAQHAAPLQIRVGYVCQVGSGGFQRQCRRWRCRRGFALGSLVGQELRRGRGNQIFDAFDQQLVAVARFRRVVADAVFVQFFLAL